MAKDKAKCMYIWIKYITELLPLLKNPTNQPTLPNPNIISLENVQLKDIHIP